MSANTITAIEVCASAYRQAQLDQTLTSFSTTQEWPYNIALDLLNTVIREMNLKGHFWFSEVATALTYSSESNTWNLSSLGIDHQSVTRVRRTLTGYEGELERMNYRKFQQLYQNAPTSTQEPVAYTVYNATLYTSSIPDQDYGLMAYNYQNLPLLVNPSDNFTIPDEYLDVVQEGVYAYLLQRAGIGDFGSAYQLYQAKLMQILKYLKRNTGTALQMPAAF